MRAAPQRSGCGTELRAPARTVSAPLAGNARSRYHAGALVALFGNCVKSPTSNTRGDHAVQNTSFLETQTIRRALEFALAKGGFGRNARQKKAAAALVKEMKSTKTVSGRHELLKKILKKGATIEQMIKATGSSRRTIFRYLNHFEEAGVDLVIENGKYKLK